MPPTCSIMDEITRAEDAISTCYKRINDVDNKIKGQELPADYVKSLQLELDELRKLLATNEEHLSALHQKNRVSYAFAACLFFICFLLYGTYILLTNDEEYS